MGHEYPIDDGQLVLLIEYKALRNILCPFQVATIFVGLSVITSLMTICSLIMMFFMRSTTVFHICGWMQILSGE